MAKRKVQVLWKSNEWYAGWCKYKKYDSVKAAKAAVERLNKKDKNHSYKVQ
jgi:hypothetical protein